jgi:hypothetical protein
MIQISEGYKIVSKKINLLQNSLEKEIKNLEADISSLDSIHVRSLTVKVLHFFLPQFFLPE